VPLFIKDAEPLALRRIERHREHFTRLARVVLPGAEAKTAAGSFQEPGWASVPRVQAETTGAVQAVVQGTTLILHLGEVVDLTREKERLGKEIGKLDAELAKIAAKLGNPNFLAKAQAEVVEEQREREADASRDRERLKTAYDRLTVT